MIISYLKSYNGVQTNNLYRNNYLKPYNYLCLIEILDVITLCKKEKKSQDTTKKKNECIMNMMP